MSASQCELWFSPNETRYASEYIGGYNAATRASREFTNRARAEIDVDEPTFENLQALVLLALASFQAGKGKKAYMLLSMKFANVNVQSC